LWRNSCDGAREWRTSLGYPEAVEEKDGAGRLPVLSAIKNETTAAAAIVDIVLDANPEAIKDNAEWIEVRKFLMVLKKKIAQQGIH